NVTYVSTTPTEGGHHARQVGQGGEGAGGQRLRARHLPRPDRVRLRLRAEEPARLREAPRLEARRPMIYRPGPTRGRATYQREGSTCTSTRSGTSWRPPWTTARPTLRSAHGSCSCRTTPRTRCRGGGCSPSPSRPASGSAPPNC